MPAKGTGAKARSFRLMPHDLELLDRLTAHYLDRAPDGFRVTPSDVMRLALSRLAEAELDRGTKGRARP
jgi:hypothetical protein